MKRTAYKISLITFILALAICLGALIGINIPVKAAGTVTVNGSNVFTATGEANVIADRQKGEPAEDGSDTYKYYTLFAFGFDGDAVSYRKNLAYSWYVAGEDGKGANGLFNMTLGFKNTEFEKFVVKFESQVYEKKTKETKTENSVVFYPVQGDSGKVYAVICDDADKAEAPENGTALDAADITVKFTEKLGGGKYGVSVGNETASISGEFVNVGGNYAKSSTSTSNPVYPLIFKAQFEGGKAAEGKSAQMTLYSLNGQSFELNGSEPSYNSEKDYYYGGTVTDDTPPVLCLEEELNYLTLGKEIDIDYAVIDVLRSSPRADLYYYLLTYDQYKEEGFDYNNKDDEELFREVTSSDNYILESSKDKYLPVKETEHSAVFGEDKHLEADMAAKVYLKLTDITSNGESCDVFLDWYVPEAYKLDINGSGFIAVAKDTRGATFNYDGADGKSWQELIGEYQAKVSELAKDLSAGSSSYLYLPSVESLFADNATAYTDLKISVYYYNTTQQSNSGLATNNLSINVTNKGDYVFTVYATDAAGNKMWYLDDDGEVQEFAASDVWAMFNDKDDEDLDEKLPWFKFYVGYTGVKFEEEPGLQATAYVDASYSSASFKINGISGSYDTQYKLYLFDRAGYYTDTKITLSYEQYVERLDTLFSDAQTRKYFKAIPAISDMEETDPEYGLYKDYGWNKSSTTFTPQDSNAFYLIRAEVTDTQYNTDPVACNMGVVASVKSKTLKGENDWAKNNVASIVLLCIAGVALICIVLLLVIKPKNEGDVDETYEKVRKNKKNGK